MDLCEIDGKIYLDGKSLYNDQRTKHNDNPKVYKCTLCDKIFCKKIIVRNTWRHTWIKTNTMEQVIHVQSVKKAISKGILKMLMRTRFTTALMAPSRLKPNIWWTSGRFSQMNKYIELHQIYVVLVMSIFPSLVHFDPLVYYCRPD